MSNASWVTIRRADNALEISWRRGEALPDELRRYLAAPMTYTHLKHRRGLERYDPATGEKLPPVALEDRALYAVNRQGHLLTGAGYLPRIQEMLTRLGIEVRIGDQRRPPSHPEAYTPNIDNMLRYLTPRDKQLELFSTLMASECGTIWGPPGLGKSYSFLGMVTAYPLAKHAIVIPDVDNVNKTRRLLSAHLAHVGQVGGGHHVLDHRVTVYTIDSFHYYPGDADFVWADEVHRMASEEHAARLAQQLTSSRNFCFTATLTTRADNAWARIEPLFGPLIYHMTQQEAVQAGLILPTQIVWHAADFPRNPAARYKDKTARLRHGIWQHAARNELIAEIARGYGAQEQVLIMVATIEHAVRLQQYLPEFRLCYGNMTPQRLERYKLAGDLPMDFKPLTAKERETLRLRFEQGLVKKVIATDVWSTGVSFNALRILIRADGRQSATLGVQIPGRTNRLHDDSGKECGIVHDFLDKFDHGFHQDALRRKRTYAEEGHEQVVPMARRVGV